MTGEDEKPLSLMEQAAGLLLYGWPLLLALVVVAAVVGLTVYLAQDYVKYRRRRARWLADSHLPADH